MQCDRETRGICIVNGLLTEPWTRMNTLHWRGYVDKNRMHCTMIWAGFLSLVTHVAYHLIGCDLGTLYIDDLKIYLRVHSLHRNFLPTLWCIPLMTNAPLYPITHDSSCHRQRTMPRNPWSFPMTSSAWPVCMNVCVLQWWEVCTVIL